MFPTTAAIFSADTNAFSIEDIELAELQPKEVRVKLHASGVCHMDMAAPELVAPPAIYGHEGVGTVVEIGTAVTRFRPGDRVVMSYGSCGACANCDDGKPYHCDNSWDVTFTGRRADKTPTAYWRGKPVAAAFFQQSSFAQHAVTLEDGLVGVSDDTPSEILAALPCGVLTGVGVVFEQLNVRPGNSIAIFGAGAVGLSSVMAARIVGASPIIAVDLNDDRLALARELGATETINPSQGDVAKLLLSAISRGVQFAVDTTGSSKAFDAAVHSLGVGGELAACILPSPMDDFSFQPMKLFEQAASLKFVSFGNATPKNMIPKMIDLFKDGRLPVDKLIKTYPFENINDACADAKRGAAIKPVLTFND